MSTPAAASGSRYSCAAACSSGPPVTPCLDELHEPRAGLGRQGDVGCRRERVLVGQRVGRRAGADDADAAAAGGGDGPAGGGQDHLDHGYVVPLAGVAEHRGAGRVAGDDEGLDALVDEVVEALEGVLADLGDRLGAVGLARGVAEVDHCLVGQLVHHGPGDGEPTEARVEDPDRRVSHNQTRLVRQRHDHGPLATDRHSCRLVRAAQQPPQADHREHERDVAVAGAELATRRSRPGSPRARSRLVAPTTRTPASSVPTASSASRRRPVASARVATM